jgi:UDP:flavonoid glycosyltransferase YjiC (YdhE family)
VRILFTTMPLRGHFFPLVPLAWAFRAAGHEVLVATAESFVPTVLRSGLPGMPVGPAVDFVDLVASDPDASMRSVGPTRGGSATLAHPRNIEELQYAHGRAFATIASRSLPGVTSLVTAWRPDLVVSERAELSGPLAAAVHGVPWVEYQWGVGLLDGYRSAAVAELASELSAAGLRALPEPAEVLTPWPPGLRQPHAVAHQGMRDVAYNGEAEVSEWILRTDRPTRVCLTFGTIVPRIRAPRVQDIIVSILERVAGLGVELLVAADEEVVAAWPVLPPSVGRVGRLPLAQVLPTCDLMVNHGGQGTVLTALVVGCPQLILPQFDDQFDNADAVVRAGAGLSLWPEEVTPARVAERCRELLEEARFGRASARVAAEIAAQPSPAEVIGLLEKLAP